MIFRIGEKRLRIIAANHRDALRSAGAKKGELKRHSLSYEVRAGSDNGEGTCSEIRLKRGAGRNCSGLCKNPAFSSSNSQSSINARTNLTSRNSCSGG